MRKVNLQDLDNITGQMVVISKVNLFLDSEKGKGSGREVQEIAINMRDLTKLIKKMDMAYLLGQQEMYTKDTMKPI